MGQSLIIAFGHKAQQGKDTAVKTIIENRCVHNIGGNSGFDIRHYAFGDALRKETEEAVSVYGNDYSKLIDAMRLTHNLPDWVQFNPNGIVTEQYPHGKQSTLLQWWGGDYRRGEDPYYWVKKLRTRIRAEKPQIALISDMRYRNEMAWVRSEDGFSCRVERQGFLAGDRRAQHASETELDNAKYDYEINVTDGDVNELKKDALYVFDHIIDSFSVDSIVTRMMSDDEIKSNTLFKSFDKDGKEITAA
jgi:hypothetical protein